jgi:hypothetical protein
MYSPCLGCCVPQEMTEYETVVKTGELSEECAPSQVLHGQSAVRSNCLTIPLLNHGKACTYIKRSAEPCFIRGTGCPLQLMSAVTESRGITRSVHAVNIETHSVIIHGFVLVFIFILNSFQTTKP